MILKGKGMSKYKMYSWKDLSLIIIVGKVLMDMGLIPLLTETLLAII